MKKLLILVSKKGKKKKALVNYLIKELEGRAKITLARLDDLIVEIDCQEVKAKINEQNLADFNLVYFRQIGDFSSLAVTIAFYLDCFGIKYVDSLVGEAGLLGSKLTSLIKYSSAGLPVMPTFFCLRNKIKEKIDYLENKFGFPLIAKEISRQRGEGVFLLKNRADFDFLNRVDPSDQFMFQKFYSHKLEYRLLVLGNKVMVVEKKIRTNKREFRNNVCLGAREEFIPVSGVSAEMRQIAVKAAKIRKLEVAGVDILIDETTGKQWLLEVNRCPAFTYNPRISPELAAMADFFTAELNLSIKK